MQFIYGFIYYFLVIWTILTAALFVFIMPMMRKLLVKIWRNFHNVLENDVINYAKIMVFAIIGFVFLQSLYVYSLLKSHFSTRSMKLLKRMGGLQNADLIIPESSNVEGYLLALKEYKEFYLAERNMMLVISAIFVFFVFQRLFYNIRKYSEMESEIEEHKAVKKDRSLKNE